MANVLWTQVLGVMHLARIRVGVRQAAPGIPDLFTVAPERVVETCVEHALAAVSAVRRRLGGVGARPRREDVGAPAALHPAHEPRRHHPQRRDDARRGAARSARPAAEAGVDDRLGGLLRASTRSSACARLARSSACGKPSVATKPGQHEPDVDAVGASSSVQRVGPAGQRELAGRVGAGAGARDAAGGARHVDDRARRRRPQQRQQRLGEADDGVEVHRHRAPDVRPPAVGERRRARRRPRC